ncbi:uncharacterized protein A4U43_C07F23750 [Asparagus officinalis]|uniref:Protein kinase domain-containing protein n=1 Tax=Asparagus officinalis TaxID=4686 RepID=A0A5P1EGC3_ASPOF|nr:probable serine/threonine-protein kinase PBL11 [Asparagus officinalis]ONK64257.1 uncharacterized protein A4U43_C07F23750 [Asparagus officinalis]
MGNCMGFSRKSLSPPNTKLCRSSPEPSTSKASNQRTTDQPAGKSTSREKVRPVDQNLQAGNLRVYSLAELKMATENFKPQAIIGEGEFGKVFKGWVDKNTLNPAISGNGMPIAVKRYYLENMQGLEEWLSEIRFSGKLSHPNVVKLLGCCRKDRELVLVYEFMQLGSLEKHLFASGKGFKLLSWSTRLKIAINAAQGLAFLHNLDKQVIYRNFKTSNILLDSGYNAKLSDFGLAKNGPTDEASHVITKLKGTYGYAAPEYVATGHLYVKSDVYSFGVVLLEILSGKRAFDPIRSNGKQYLVDWAKPYLSNYIKLTRVMDPNLKGQYPSKGALQVSQLILRCLSYDRKARPSMREVVEVLEQVEEMEVKESSKSSWGCNRGQDSVSHPLPLPLRRNGAHVKVAHRSSKVRRYVA